METPAAERRVVVIGREARSVGHAVRSRRGPGAAVAGFVGDDDEAARQMADEMLGGVDALVTLGGGEGSAGGATTPGLSPDA